LVAADTSYGPTLHVLLFNMYRSNAKTQENSDNHGLTTTPCSRQGCPVVICSASREQVSLPTFSGRASLQAQHRSHRYEKPAKAALLANCTRYIKLISHNPLPILSANVSALYPSRSDSETITNALSTNATRLRVARNNGGLMIGLSRQADFPVFFTLSW
jgi:hypothetical protein